ncbi:MAG: Gfo/Idh/MocA family oxidoreductase [Bacteroidota bacterium]
MSLRQFISSRIFLRSFNIVKDNAVLRWREVAALFGLHDDVYYNPLHKKIQKPVHAILIGAGHRGTIYASYASKYPKELKIVGVADVNPQRRKKTATEHKIPVGHCFTDWKDVFALEKFADAVIIATPDYLHTQPCLAALDAGYDILLEKPIAPTEEECRIILQKAKDTNRIVGVCHVLRYSPY